MASVTEKPALVSAMPGFAWTWIVEHMHTEAWTTFRKALVGSVGRCQHPWLGIFSSKISLTSELEGTQT